MIKIIFGELGVEGKVILTTMGAGPNPSAGCMSNSERRLKCFGIDLSRNKFKSIIVFGTARNNCCALWVNTTIVRENLIIRVDGFSPDWQTPAQCQPDIGFGWVREAFFVGGQT